MSSMDVALFTGLLELMPYQGGARPPSKLSIWLDTRKCKDGAPEVHSTRYTQFSTTSWDGGYLGGQHLVFVIPSRVTSLLANNQLGTLSSKYCKTQLNARIRWKLPSHDEKAGGSAMGIGSDEESEDEEETFRFRCKWSSINLDPYQPISFHLRLAFVDNRPQLQRIPIAGSHLTLDEDQP